MNCCLFDPDDYHLDTLHAHNEYAFLCRVQGVKILSANTYITPKSARTAGIRWLKRIHNLENPDQPPVRVK